MRRLYYAAKRVSGCLYKRELKSFLCQTLLYSVAFRGITISLNGGFLRRLTAK